MKKPKCVCGHPESKHDGLMFRDDCTVEKRYTGTCPCFEYRPLKPKKRGKK